MKIGILEGMMDCFSCGSTAACFRFFLKGAYDSPKGSRLKGGYLETYRMSPQFVRYAMLVSGMLCTVDYSMQYLRQKDDQLNKITAGAASVGVLGIRYGLGPATRSFVFCSAFLGLLAPKNKV